MDQRPSRVCRKNVGQRAGSSSASSCAACHPGRYGERRMTRGRVFKSGARWPKYHILSGSRSASHQDSRSPEPRRSERRKYGAVCSPASMSGSAALRQPAWLPPLPSRRRESAADNIPSQVDMKATVEKDCKKGLPASSLPAGATASPTVNQKDARLRSAVSARYRSFLQG